MGPSWVYEWYIHFQNHSSVTHKNKIFAQGPQTCAKCDAGLLFNAEWMVMGIHVWLTVGCVLGGDDFRNDVSGTAMAGRVGWLHDITGSV